jgi:hypothetical protein
VLAGWRALRGSAFNEWFSDWGDEHMVAGMSLSLGSLLLGAVTGGFLGHRLSRRLFPRRDLA